MRFFHKLNDPKQWPFVKWSFDEGICVRMVTNQILIYNMNDNNNNNNNNANNMSKIRVENVSRFAIGSALNSDVSAPPLHYIATFAAEKKVFSCKHSRSHTHTHTHIHTHTLIQ